MRLACQVVWTVAISLGMASPGLAGELGNLKSSVDQLIGPLIDSGAVVGLVVGLHREGQSTVWGYGKVAQDSEQTPDGRTLFEIGSITKVFTALALADLAEEGLVRLDDPVSDYLPATVRVPTRDGRPITLLDLATHTSGLPRLPENLLGHIAKHPENPYAAYTLEQFYEAISDTSLATTPGEHFTYSNFGMGLLGHVLARRAGVDYETLIEERICQPLGLSDTRITLSDAQRSRFAEAHDADARPIPAWDLPTLAGAGALRSTADDLLRFVSANLGLYPSRLAPAIAATHIARHKISDMASVGLAWQLDPKQRLFWHNGQTGGFHSFVAFQTDRKVGVVVLSNTTSKLIDPLGNQLLRLLLGLPAQHLKVRMPIRLDPATLDQYVGKYPMFPGFEIVVFREGERLLAQATNQPALGIYPESETEFFYRAVDARITFTKDKAGNVTKLVLHQNGLALPAWKGGLSVRLGTGLFKSLLGKPEDKDR